MLVRSPSVHSVDVPRGFSRTLSTVLASTSAIALMAPAARAADGCVKVNQSCIVSRNGAPATPAGDPSGNGKKGGDGGDAAGIDLGLSGSTVYRDFSVYSPLTIQSLGAAGQQGSKIGRAHV